MTEPRLITADVLDGLKLLEPGSIQCVVTSPPYWNLRDYGIDGQIGLEETPDDFVDRMVEVFAAVRRVLADDGVLWLNLGDSYAGSGNGGGGSYEKERSSFAARAGRVPIAGILKRKDLVGMPWRVALALQADGWWLRSDIVWAKPCPMPESIKDRPTRSHEYIFMLTKSERYYYDADAVRTPAKRPSGNWPEGWAKGPGPRDKDNSVAPAKKQRGHGRRHAGFNERWDKMTRDEQMANGANLRDVWTVNSAGANGYPGAHFACFPLEIPKRCILASSRPADTVLDPFSGTATTGQAALELGRSYVGIELNPEYQALAEERLRGAQMGMAI